MKKISESLIASLNSVSTDAMTMTEGIEKLNTAFQSGLISVNQFRNALGVDDVQAVSDAMFDAAPEYYGETEDKVAKALSELQNQAKKQEVKKVVEVTGRKFREEE